MDYKELVHKLVNELSYRVGIPNVKDKTHQSIMSEILSEWGEYDAKQRIFEFLTEEPRKFNDLIKIEPLSIKIKMVKIKKELLEIF